MNNYLKAIIGTVITALIGTIIYLICLNREITSFNQSNTTAYRDTIRTYQIKVDSLTNMVAEKSALILTQQQAIKAGFLDKERLRKTNLTLVATNVQLLAEVSILKDSLKLPKEVLFVTVKDTSGTYDAVRLPFEWQYQDKYLNLKTGIHANKTAYFDLKTTIEGNITVGYDKGKPKAVITTTNPYVLIKEMDAVIIANPTPFYKKWWFGALVGGLTVGLVGVAL